jgi:hypothetical protein
VFTDGCSVVYADRTQVSGFVFTNNILPDNAWAVMGSIAAEGNGTLAMYYPGAAFVGNSIIRADASACPSRNFFLASASAGGFVSLSGGNYRLSDTSHYRTSATDGTAVGCNIDTLPK